MSATEESKFTPEEEAAYKDLARINGEINRMMKEDISDKLKSLHLDSSGSKDVLKKRLKSYYKNTKISELSGGESLVQQYQYYVVIDFEATCDINTRAHNTYMHEIIEFPAVLVSSENQEIVGVFHQYCKPTYNTQLSQFCKDLTGISQRNVNRASTFPVVLKSFESWLKENNLTLDNHNKWSIVTDGPWDMGRFMRLQCQISGIPFPKYARKWVNIRKAFSTFYKDKHGTHSLNDMLSSLGLEFEGRPHSGLDDSKNVAQILIRLLKDSANVLTNERYNVGAGLRVEIDLKKVNRPKKCKEHLHVLENDSDNG